MEKSDQKEILIGRCNWFASRSQIIITRRDKYLLHVLRIGHSTYKVKKLDDHEALELFRI